MYILLWHWTEKSGQIVDLYADAVITCVDCLANSTFPWNYQLPLTISSFIRMHYEQYFVLLLVNWRLWPMLHRFIATGSVPELNVLDIGFDYARVQAWFTLGTSCTKWFESESHAWIPTRISHEFASYCEAGWIVELGIRPIPTNLGRSGWKIISYF